MKHTIKLQMNRCPQCGVTEGVSNAGCSACGFIAPVVDGLRRYAPDLVDSGPGYDPVHYAQLAGFEAGNFWFQARNRIILETLDKHVRGPGRFLEIGCGTGFVLQAITKHRPDLEVYGCELFVSGLAFARQRVSEAFLFQMDACRPPFEACFDAIGAFDVMEHIDDQEKVLIGFHRALVPGGFLFLTVPQHRWLWSQSDVDAHHVRRYEPGELEAVLRKEGFEIVESFAFVSLLLPLLALSRFFSRKTAKNNDPYREFRMSRFANSFFSCVMRLESTLRHATGVKPTLGGSRLVVAQRPLSP